MPDTSVLKHPTRRPDAMVDNDGVRLACYTDGNKAGPKLVFVHGFPDTAYVWDRLVAQLADDFFCIRYDVRGAGQSDRPTHTRDYALVRLESDLAAVLDWACAPGERVHLIGHDWGSIQSWEAATDPRMADRLASYTSISGPCLDHVGHSLRHRDPGRSGGAARQARRSWYVGLFQIPGLAELGWRYGLAPRWPATLARLENERLPVAPTWIADGLAGIRLYRANMLGRLVRPRARRATVPVHLIVARQDPFVGPALAEGASRWCETIHTTVFDAGHWLIITRAPSVAREIRAYLNSLDNLDDTAPASPPAEPRAMA